MFRKSLLLLGFLSLFLVSCNGQSSPETVQEKKQDHYIFVVPIQENEYWQNCMDGIARADAELGTTTTVIGPETASQFAETLPDYLEAAVDAAPDGIITYAGLESLQEGINSAGEDGIPVLTVDSDASETSRIAYLGTDLHELGWLSGMAMADKTGGDGKVAWVCTSEEATNEAEVHAAFLDAIYDYKLHETGTIIGQADPDLAEQAVEAYLEAHPDTTALFCTGGYNATGAARVKEKLDLDLVIVGFDDVPENVDFVKKGILDVLVVQSPEQLGYQGVHLLYEYRQSGSLPQEIYTIPLTIVTKDNVDTYNQSGYARTGNSKTVRVGYYSGDVRFQDGFSDTARKSGYGYEYLLKVAGLTGWNYEYVYASRTDCMDMIEKGEVDLVAGVYNTDFLEDKVQFSRLGLGLEDDNRSIAIANSRPDLLLELDAAMEQLLSDSPGWQNELYQKYYGEVTRQQVLSKEEAAWLKDKGVLKMGYIRHNLPLSDQASDGSPAGLAANLQEQFSSYLHTEITATAFENVDAMEAALQNGEIDFAFPVYADTWLNENKGFSQTNVVFSDRVMICFCGSYDPSMLDNVGLSGNGVGQRYYLSINYPDSQTTFFDSRQDAFEAVVSGEVGCTVGASNILQRFIATHPDYQDLNVSYLNSSEDFTVVMAEGNAHLNSIMNKAVEQLDSNMINNAVVRYSDVTNEYTLSDYIRSHVFDCIFLLSLLLAGVVLIYLRYHRRSEDLNHRLQEALTEAEAANDAKTTFLSCMSHDIRTPMNAIVGMTAIASRHLEDPARMEDCLKKIDLNSHHLLTLINDVLDISKIESGKLTLNPTDFSLKDMFIAISSIIRPQAKAKEQEFNMRMHGLVHEKLHGDEVRFNQIVINLLSNAIKYTPEHGHINVDLYQTVLDDGKRVQIKFQVADDGMGMSEDFMANMYETFTRAQDHRVDKIQGTGLGLSIVKRMVDMMGGTIECTSTEGKGTTFVVVLQFPVAEVQTALPDISGTRILLVDDDPVFLESSALLLEDMGAVVETASSCQEALEKVSAGFDLYIVDWKMPDVDGMETCIRLRLAAGPDVCILLDSAYDLEDGEVALQSAGVNAFVNKPLFPSEITGIILNHQNQALQANDRHDWVKERPLHVLVAEDNDMNWEIIEELLDVYGIKADRAENGQEAVDILHAAAPGTYDLVFMDVQMPVMGGKDATRHIRSSTLTHLSGIPIVAMTADAFAEDIAACLEAGMDDHVAKPVNMEQLLQTIKKVLDHKKKDDSK